MIKTSFPLKKNLIIELPNYLIQKHHQATHLARKSDGRAVDTISFSSLFQTSFITFIFVLLLFVYTKQKITVSHDSYNFITNF